jgi:hypothetical protein
MAASGHKRILWLAARDRGDSMPTLDRDNDIGSIAGHGSRNESLLDDSPLIRAVGLELEDIARAARFRDNGRPTDDDAMVSELLNGPIRGNLSAFRQQIDDDHVLRLAAMISGDNAASI